MFVPNVILSKLSADHNFFYCKELPCNAVEFIRYQNFTNHNITRRKVRYLTSILIGDYETGTIKWFFLTKNQLKAHLEQYWRPVHSEDVEWFNRFFNN